MTQLPLPLSLPRRYVCVRALGGGGSGPLGAWLDLASLVSSGAKTPGVNTFADTLGSEVYVDVAGWHLYLKDAKLAPAVASALAAKVSGGKAPSEADVRDTCAKIPVRLGGGKSVLSLLDVMPERCVQDMVDITRRYANKEL